MNKGPKKKELTTSGRFNNMLALYTDARYHALIMLDATDKNHNNRWWDSLENLHQRIVAFQVWEISQCLHAVFETYPEVLKIRLKWIADGDNFDSSMSFHMSISVAGEDEYYHGADNAPACCSNVDGAEILRQAARHLDDMFPLMFSMHLSSINDYYSAGVGRDDIAGIEQALAPGVRTEIEQLSMQLKTAPAARRPHRSRRI